jgi:hypothetical protein
MKAIFNYAILSAALLVGFSGCNNEDESSQPGGSESNTVVVKVPFTHTQEATTKGGVPRINDLKVFFVGDGIIEKVGEITAADITESGVTKSFNDIPVSATDVIIIANANILGSPDLSGVVEGSPVGDLGKVAFVQSVQASPESVDNLYGTGVITGTSPDRTVSVIVTPVVSRIKIGKIEAKEGDSDGNIALAGFKLTGIYINNTYTELGSDYETTPDETTKILNYGSDATKWIDGAYPVRFRNDFFDVTRNTSFVPPADTEWSYYIFPPKSGNGTVINGKKQSSIPHIILKIEGATTKTGASLLSPAYVTVRELKVNGKALSQLERGKVYNIASLAIGGQYLAPNPEANVADTLFAEATVTSWSEEKITVGGGESSVFNTPTANCYIVAPGVSGFLIPVFRANLDGIPRIGATDELTAELVWTDVANPLTSGSAIRSISVQGVGSSAYLSVSTGSAEGNAVVAVKVGSEIKWSWHIWVTGYVPTGKPGTFMDRNLGALSNNRNDKGGVNTLGLLYQWGRKDPFPGSSAVSSGVEPVIYNADGVINGITKEVAPSGPNLEVSVTHPLTFYYIA